MLVSFKVKSSIFKNYFLSDTFVGVVGVQNLLSENYVTTLIDDSDIAENIVIVQNIIRPGMDEVRPGGLSDCYISQSLWYEPLPGHRQWGLEIYWILMVSDQTFYSFLGLGYCRREGQRTAKFYWTIFFGFNKSCSIGQNWQGPNWRLRPGQLSMIGVPMGSKGFLKLTSGMVNKHGFLWISMQSNKSLS